MHAGCMLYFLLRDDRCWQYTYRCEVRKTMILSTEEKKKECKVVKNIKEH